jgi:TolB protein
MRTGLALLVLVAVLGTSYAVRGALPDDPGPGGADDEIVTLSGTVGDGEEAPVVVSVVPASREMDPVAVPRPICGPGETEICATIQEVLRRDLTLSAFFSVLPAQSYLADMDQENLKRTKWDDWFNVGARYLVKVDVAGAGAEHDVSFRLYDVSNRAVMEVAGQDAMGLKASEVVPRTHDFVNELIRTVTGMPGLFGSTILYSAKSSKTTRAIYAIGIDGSGRRALAGGSTLNMFPSMVGGTLVYTSFKAGKPDVYVNGNRVTTDSRHYRGARLSPDGSVIAAAADDGGQSDIFLMSAGGKILRNLTNSGADEVSPSWSPDGGKIAYVSNRTGGPQIYVMGRDGGGSRRVTFAGGYNSTPDFGPDGRIVFAGMDEGHSDIFVTDLEGNVQRITQDQGSNKDPAFSPDGRHIVFVSSRDGGWRIWLSTSDGRYQFPITERTGGYSTLSWAK